jgi:cobalt/nickel transport system ATP-binding protein
MDPVIAARGVRHEYPDGTRAVDGVDVDICAGERVAVVGANGSGKSTLQAVLGGLVEPTSGTVRYFGETNDPESVRNRLGVLLQDPDDYLFNTTVREDIEYGPAQLGVSRGVADERITSLVDALGLDGLLDRPPFRLSGGEKQRAAVASVLSFAPDVLLLDEPLGAVDAVYRERILSLLDDHGGTTVTFTPSLDLVPTVADRVLLLSGGEIVADDDVRSVVTDRDLLARHGLGAPAVVRLFDGRVDRADVPLTVGEAREYLAEREGRE